MTSKANILTKFVGGIASVAAAATVTAGVVWAGDNVLSSGGVTSILQSVGVVAEDSSEDPDDPGTPEDLEARLDDLTARLDAIDARLDGIDAAITAVDQRAGEALTAAARAEEAAASNPDGMASLRAAVDAIAGDVTALSGTVQRRTANINDEGRYTGGLRPTQFEGRLTVGDVRGDWPLDRVLGVLDRRNLFRGSFSCYSDYRNYGVVSVDSAGQFTCLKIPKTP